MPKVGEVLTKAGGPTVEEARAAMLAAGEAPRGEHAVPIAVADPEPEFPEELPGLPAPAAPAPEPAAAAPATVAPPTPEPKPEEPKTLRYDMERFIAEIKQDAGKWVAEIRYKLGNNLIPGVERFVAASKNELMAELLKGKANATLRVKQAVRREKLGMQTDQYQPLPEGVTADEFSKLPEKSQIAMIDLINVDQCKEFMHAHPEYYQTQENGDALIKFLKEQKLPVTVRNLELAFEDLDAEGLLAHKPEPEPAPTSSATPTVTPAAADSAPAVPAQPESSAPAPAAAPAAPVVRKRGSTGLQPGQSSAPSSAPVSSEEGKQPKDLSEAELRKRFPAGDPKSLAELKRIATADRVARSRVG